mmetsp:Transcript_33317/g.84421  ORF Transcript_33317/g.84421 Transcript_33317/m.84421 type:complete len:328 (+) Transcript_33317:992-1975(+)
MRFRRLYTTSPTKLRHQNNTQAPIVMYQDQHANTAMSQPRHTTKQGYPCGAALHPHRALTTSGTITLPCGTQSAHTGPANHSSASMNSTFKSLPLLLASLLPKTCMPQHCRVHSKPVVMASKGIDKSNGSLDHACLQPIMPLADATTRAVTDAVAAATLRLCSRDSSWLVHRLLTHVLTHHFIVLILLVLHGGRVAQPGGGVGASALAGRAAILSGAAVRARSAARVLGVWPSVGAALAARVAATPCRGGGRRLSRCRLLRLQHVLLHKLAAHARARLRQALAALVAHLLLKIPVLLLLQVLGQCGLPVRGRGAGAHQRHGARHGLA